MMHWLETATVWGLCGVVCAVGAVVILGWTFWPHLWRKADG